MCIHTHTYTYIYIYTHTHTVQKFDVNNIFFFKDIKDNIFIQKGHMKLPMLQILMLQKISISNKCFQTFY